jgi:hypothetical protein
MKKILTLIALCLFFLNANSQNNKGFKNPLIWLRADSMGEMAGQWKDVSGNHYSAFVQNNQALPDSGLFNFHRCFVFDTLSNPLTVNYRAKKDARMLVFAVYKPITPQMEKGIWALGLDSTIQVKLTTQRLKNVYKFIRYDSSTSALPTINVLAQNWRNKHIDTTISSLFIGGTDSLNFTGKFAEFILYDSTLANNDLLKLHTYLAIKYGVSIRDMNCVGSNDSILWDYKKDTLYQNDIAGIGKDSIIQINQKQSAGNGGDSPLKIAAGNLKISNDANTSQIAEGDFFIWGNNGQNLTDVNQDTLDTTVISNMSRSVWLMKKSGVTASTISTQVVLNASEIYGAININLVINRTGNPSFPSESSIVITPDSIDAEMNYYFSNVNWDTDNSGTDIFGFQVIPSVNNNSRMNDTTNNTSSTTEISDNYKNDNANNQNNISDNSSAIIDCSMFPNPTMNAYTITIKLSQELPIQVTIQTETGKRIEGFERKGSSEYTLKGYLKDKGCYLVTIVSGKDSKTYKLVVE